MNLLAAASAVHYLPIGTTILSAVFFAVMARHYLLRNRGWHILWWAIGILTYGAGTAIESTITLAGNTVPLNKAWYIVGALLGGYPLAQGSVYLHIRRRWLAHALTIVTLLAIAVASVAVVLSPVNLAALEPHRPTGKILEWRWIRTSITPAINTYALVFLVGGAIYSAWWFYRSRTAAHRVTGNTLIAVGALLPGVGGSFAAAGHVEALYIGEFAGIILIWIGYRYCLAGPRPLRADTTRITAI